LPARSPRDCKLARNIFRWEFIAFAIRESRTTKKQQLMFARHIVGKSIVKYIITLWNILSRCFIIYKFCMNCRKMRRKERGSQRKASRCLRLHVKISPFFEILLSFLREFWQNKGQENLSYEKSANLVSRRPFHRFFLFFLCSLCSQPWLKRIRLASTCDSNEK